MLPALSALVEAGLLPLAEAEQIDRSLDPVAARAHAEQLLTDAFARGLTAQQRRLLNVLDSSQGQPTPANLARLWAQEDELLWLGVREDIIDVASEHGVRASINAADPNTWQLVNEEVVNFVDGYYVNPAAGNFGSIPNLNQTSKEEFSRVFQMWQLGDRTPGNYAQGLPQLINELQPIFGLQRARVIAATETSRVFAESERFAAARNPFIEYFQYLASADEKVCPICLPADNTVIPKDSNTFPDGRGFPPRHPNCRCSITQLSGPALQALREEGLIAESQ